MSKKKSKEPKLSPRRKKLFSILLYTFPIIVLVLFELVLRLFQYGGNLDVFITGPEKQISHYWMGNPNLGERYFFRQNTKPAPPKDLFLKEKPQNGYRIFVLGGSTAAGFPYGYNVMFSRILNFQLTHIFPDKYIEVVNVAMSAVNTYTILDILDEVLAQKPDAILIYAGHNEFYGAMGVGSQEKLAENPKVINAYLKLKRFRIFLLVRNIVGTLQKEISKVTTGGTEIDPTNTLMARIVADQSIPYKSEMYERGISQYRTNLDKILQKTAEAGVPVILSELVSNVKDQKPFVSVETDSFPPAEQTYLTGKKLLEQGDYNEARTTLTLAKDLDALRFRATEEMNGIIHELAEKHHVPVVPMKKIFESHSQNNIIGNELILEHLHPNMQGYFLMADAFLHALKENHFIADNWDESRIRSIEAIQKEWGLTEIDTVAANLSIFYLKGGWPFKPAVMPNRALEQIKPKTRVDSLSLRVLTDKNFSIVVGHVEMARYYEKKKQYEKAFREYKAAYYTIPFELQFYEGAVRNLLYLKRYDEALEILEFSHRYGNTPFTDKWTGQLYLSKERIEESLPYLERARQSLPEDQQLLRHLHMAYTRLGDDQKAEEINQLIVSESEAQKPELADVQLDEQKKEMIYAMLVKKASEMIKKREYAKAISLLERAHSMKQTPYTFKWLGLLNLSGNRVEKAVDYLYSAIELKPKDFELHYNLCNALILLKRKAEAQSILDKMEQLRPGFKDPQNLRGRIAALQAG